MTRAPILFEQTESSPDEESFSSDTHTPLSPMVSLAIWAHLATKYPLLLGMIATSSDPELMSKLLFSAKDPSISAREIVSRLGLPEPCDDEYSDKEGKRPPLSSLLTMIHWFDRESLQNWVTPLPGLTGAIFCELETELASRETKRYDEVTRTILRIMAELDDVAFNGTLRDRSGLSLHLAAAMARDTRVSDSVSRVLNDYEYRLHFYDTSLDTLFRELLPGKLQSQIAFYHRLAALHASVSIDLPEKLWSEACLVFAPFSGHSAWGLLSTSELFAEHREIELLAIMNHCVAVGLIFPGALIDDEHRAHCIEILNALALASRERELRDSGPVSLAHEILSNHGKMGQIVNPAYLTGGLSERPRVVSLEEENLVEQLFKSTGTTANKELERLAKWGSESVTRKLHLRVVTEKYETAESSPYSLAVAGLQLAKQFSEQGMGPRYERVTHELEDLRIIDESFHRDPSTTLATYVSHLLQEFGSTQDNTSGLGSGHKELRFLTKTTSREKSLQSFCSEYLDYGALRYPSIRIAFAAMVSVPPHCAASLLTLPSFVHELREYLLSLPTESSPAPGIIQLILYGEMLGIVAAERLQRLIDPEEIRAVRDILTKEEIEEVLASGNGNRSQSFGASHGMAQLQKALISEPRLKPPIIRAAEQVAPELVQLLALEAHLKSNYSGVNGRTSSPRVLAVHNFGITPGRKKFGVCTVCVDGWRLSLPFIDRSILLPPFEALAEIGVEPSLLSASQLDHTIHLGTDGTITMIIRPPKGGAVLLEWGQSKSWTQVMLPEVRQVLSPPALRSFQLTTGAKTPLRIDLHNKAPILLFRLDGGEDRYFHSTRWSIRAPQSQPAIISSGTRLDGPVVNENGYLFGQRVGENALELVLNGRSIIVEEYPKRDSIVAWEAEISSPEAASIAVVHRVGRSKELLTVYRVGEETITRSDYPLEELASQEDDTSTQTTLQCCRGTVEVKRRGGPVTFFVLSDGRSFSIPTGESYIIAENGSVYQDGTFGHRGKVARRNGERIEILSLEEKESQRYSFVGLTREGAPQELWSHYHRSAVQYRSILLVPTDAPSLDSPRISRVAHTMISSRQLYSDLPPSGPFGKEVSPMEGGGLLITEFDSSTNKPYSLLSSVFSNPYKARIDAGFCVKTHPSGMWFATPEKSVVTRLALGRLPLSEKDPGVRHHFLEPTRLSSSSGRYSSITFSPRGVILLSYEVEGRVLHGIVSLTGIDMWNQLRWEQIAPSRTRGFTDDSPDLHLLAVDSAVSPIAVDGTTLRNVDGSEIVVHPRSLTALWASPQLFLCFMGPDLRFKLYSCQQGPSSSASFPRIPKLIHHFERLPDGSSITLESILDNRLLVNLMIDDTLGSTRWVIPISGTSERSR